MIRAKQPATWIGVRVLGILLAWPVLAWAGALDCSVVDGDGKPVSDAVVYATTLSGTAPSIHPSTAVMDQRNKDFVPYVLPILVGTSVHFPNSDNVRHHVYSFSPAKVFELPLYKGSPAKPVLFDKAGVVVLGCNIHDWRQADVYVLETPYFAKTGEKGQAIIADIPAGSFEVRVWHPRMRQATETTARRVTLPQESPKPVDFKITLKQDLRIPRAPSAYGDDTYH